jgi:eukaryotic-like serine/threonine-protein kinase
VTRSPRASQLVAQDPLTEPRLWQIREDEAEKTTCLFDGALVVTRDQQCPYRCPGPTDAYTDFAFAVDVRLRNEGACAAIWSRFSDRAGYLVRICREGLYLATHGVGDGRTVRVLRTMPFDAAIPLDTATRIGVSIEDTTIALERDGEPVGTVQDATFTQGRMVLGIFPESSVHEPPFGVAFKNVEVRAFTG